MPSSANRPENGGISFRVPEEAQGWRLDKALGLLLASPSPEQEAARPDLFALADLGLRARRRLCDRSLVLVNGKPGIPGLKLRAGQEIIILPDPEGAAIPKDAPSLVYKDGGIAALYKPAGMHTAALAGSLSPSLETLLGDLLPSEEEGYASRLLNRLDAPTSGLVLASCTDGGERRWYRAERIGNTDKLYLALIEGQPLYDFTVARRLDTDTRNKTRVRHTDDPDPVRHTDVTLLAPLTAGDVPGLVESDDPDAPLMLVGCRIRKGARHHLLRFRAVRCEHHLLSRCHRSTSHIKALCLPALPPMLHCAKRRNQATGGPQWHITPQVGLPSKPLSSPATSCWSACAS